MLKLQRSVFVGLENDILSIFRNLQTSGLNCTLIYKHAVDGFLCVCSNEVLVYMYANPLIIVHCTLYRPLLHFQRSMCILQNVVGFLKKSIFRVDRNLFTIKKT